MGKISENILMCRRGFTLIELLTVIGITIILVSTIVAYGNSTRRDNALMVEQAAIAQLILRARSLSVATYNQPPIPCGYGVQFYPNDPAYGAQANTYELFSYDVSDADKRAGQCVTFTDLIGSDCRSAPSDSSYRCYRVLEAFTLREGTVLDDPWGGTGDTLSAVFFRPPDPVTRLFPDAVPLRVRFIYLKTSDGGSARQISISQSGQLSF